MIIYQSTKESFVNDVVSNNIENVILNFFKDRLGQTTSVNEIRSWKNSMQYMNNVLIDPNIPNDSGVLIEYQIPQTSKRIDFILTGQDENQVNHAILIELKQWDKADVTDKEAVVSTYVGNGNREVSHPSYQAWSYAALLEGFNEAVYTSNIKYPQFHQDKHEKDSIINIKKIKYDDIPRRRYSNKFSRFHCNKH